MLVKVVVGGSGDGNERWWSLVDGGCNGQRWRPIVVDMEVLVVALDGGGNGSRWWWRWSIMVGDGQAGGGGGGGSGDDH